MYVNFFAVVLAALVGFGVGAVWYSPWLFAKRWQELVGMDAWNVKKDGAGVDPLQAMKAHGFTPTQAMAVEFVSLLVMSFVLANLALALNTHGAFSALRLGFWIWLGFQGTLLLSGVLFERRPFELFYINAGERFAAILLMSLVVGLWH